MKKVIHYITAFLILTLSLGQKDIQLLIQDNIESKFISKLNGENETEDSEEDSKKEKENLEEEAESKRKKNEDINGNSSFIKSKINPITFLSHYCTFNNQYKSLKSKALSHLYLLLCSLVFYH